MLAAVARGQSDEAVVELCRDSKLAERFKAVLEDRIADAAQQRKNERFPLYPAHCRYPTLSRVRTGSGPATRRHSYGPSALQQCLCIEYPEYPASLSTRAPHKLARNPRMGHRGRMGRFGSGRVGWHGLRSRFSKIRFGAPTRNTLFFCAVAVPTRRRLSSSD